MHQHQKAKGKMYRWERQKIARRSNSLSNKCSWMLISVVDSNQLLSLQMMSLHKHTLHWPEQNPKFGCTTGWLFALKGDGWLVYPLQALLHFSQHALVDGRPLIGWSDLMHATEGGGLPLTAACVHWGEVNCLTSQQFEQFNVHATQTSFYMFYVFSRCTHSLFVCILA